MRKKSIVNKSTSEKIVFAIVFVLFLLYACYIIYPFVFAFNSSLKENGRAFLRDTVSLSIPAHFSNYIKAFQELETNGNSFIRMTFNSIWVAGGSMIISIMSSCLASYTICKYNFKLKNFLYALVLVVMMIPIYGALPARYRLLNQLHWIDSPLYIISAANGFDMAFLITYAFFKGISWNYAEAAFIDGAGNFKVFTKIMLPMAMPAISAIMITTFIGGWNSYEAPLLFLPNMPILASGLYAYSIKMQYFANQPVYFAGVILSLIPIVGIFVAFQNTIMTKVYTGGLKG